MNNDKLSYDLVMERIRKGVYDVKYSKPKCLLKDTDFIDGNKSAKWNKEQIDLENEKIRLHNEAIKEAKKEAKKESSRKFEDDLTIALMNEHGLNADQASKVYRKAREAGHSAGSWFFIGEAQELGELAEAILKLV